MAAFARMLRVSPAKLVTLTLALSVACATAEEPEDDGPRTPSGGTSAVGGVGGSLGGTGTAAAGKPASTGGTGTGTSGTGTGSTSSVGGMPSGAAGTTPVGTAGTSAGTAGTASGTCPQYAGAVAADSVIFNAGFGTSTLGTPKWSGYAYTYTYGAGTITPGSTGSGCFVGKKMCASGSVPAATTAGAGLGWNIAQMSGSMTKGTVPISTAVTLSFSGVTVGMRVQLSVSPTVSYCYALTAAEVAANKATIPYASFQTECWDASKATPYTSAVPIEAIQIAVPGATSGAQAFDFCVLDVEPG